MVINDLNIPGLSSAPLKTNTPLTVDADTVLTAALTLQFFEPMTRDTLQILQIFGILIGNKF